MSSRPGMVFLTDVALPGTFDCRIEIRGDDVNLIVASDASAAPEWAVTFTAAADLVAPLQRALVGVSRELYRYLEGDRGGPTPEMARRLGSAK